ncbi:MAG: hypothetical protein JNJ63_08695 [Hyphomonadaceae bacterium]|nr:hypothetical protein [Hyphomonadaceae bacterium]
MITPETIAPWVSLLTWQVLVLLAGVVFAPAIYIIVLRMRKLKFGENEVELDRRKIESMERRAEKEAETKGTADAAAAVEAIVDEDADSVTQRLEKVMQAWENIAVIIRDKARPFNGKPGLNSALTNMRLLRDHAVVSDDDLANAQQLRSDRDAYKDEPKLLTATTYRSYAVRAGHFASKLAKLNPPLPHAV